MRSSRYVPAVLALGVLVVAPKPATTAEPTVADVGRGVFEQYCSGCHGVGGKGDGPFVKYLKVPPPDLTAIAKRQGGTFPETEVAEMIDGQKAFPGHGSSDMPIWGERFGHMVPGTTAKQASVRGEVTLLVAYLRSIQQK